MQGDVAIEATACGSVLYPTTAPLDAPVTAYVLVAPLLVLENGVQQLLKSGSEPRCVLSPSHLRDPTYLPLRLPRRSGLQCKRKGLGEKLPLQICLEKLPL